jgi:hypothetical protein
VEGHHESRDHRSGRRSARLRRVCDSGVRCHVEKHQNGTIQLVDISPNAKKALRGQRGRKGREAFRT